MFHFRHSKDGVDCNFILSLFLFHYLLSLTIFALEKISNKILLTNISFSYFHNLVLTNLLFKITWNTIYIILYYIKCVYILIGKINILKNLTILWKIWNNSFRIFFQYCYSFRLTIKNRQEEIKIRNACDSYAI